MSVTAAGPCVSWLSVAGKLVDEVAAAHLADVLGRQRAAGCRLALLDFRQVPMLDRLSLDVLVEAHARFLAADGGLVLIDVVPRIARLLELTGLAQRLFTITRANTDRPADRTGSQESGTRTGDERPGTIDRAVGVIMGRTRCGVAEATEHLSVLGHATHRTLYEVAQSLLEESYRTRTTTARVHLRQSDIGGVADGAKAQRETPTT